MRAHHAAVLAGLLLWQAAPSPQITRDSTGRLRVSVAGGQGRWEDAQFDCEGNLVGAEPVDVSSYGARVDAMLTPTLRATVAAGSVSGRRNAGGDWGSGKFGGGQLAYEGQHVGIGGGFTTNPVPAELSVPNAYLRLGNANKAHFRLDVLEPTEMFYQQPVVRLGVGFGTGAERRVGGFVGLGFGPLYQNSAQTVVAADLAVPVGRFDLLLRGHAGPGNRISQWGWGGGMRLHLK